MRVIGICVCMILIAGCSSGPAQWSPAESDLVFSSKRDGNNDIYLIRAGESTWTKLTDDPAPENWPVWSPDGKKIAYQKWIDGKIDVWVMNADGSGNRQLTDDPDHDYLPSWTPDGMYITFASWRQEPQDSLRENHIYIMNTDGTDQRRFLSWSPHTSSGPRWSRDGSTFLMNVAERDGERSDIFLFDRRGNQIRQISEDDTAYVGSPEFSPDGSSISYYRDDGMTSHFVIADLDGNVIRRILNEGQNWYGRWSPDGSWMVYTTAVPGTDQADLDVRAVHLQDTTRIILLAGGPTREAEGSWRPR